jgi:hypothetical protein
MRVHVPIKVTLIILFLLVLGGSVHLNAEPGKIPITTASDQAR